MIIKSKIPEGNEDRHRELLEAKWVQIREPKGILLSILASIPFMALNFILSILIISLVSSISLSDFGINTSAISLQINLFHILGILLIVIIHEALHIIFVPNFIKSDKTCIGIMFFGGFVYTEELVSKARYMMITLAPFIIISVILPVVLGFAGLLNPYAKFLVLLNSMASSVDVLSAILIILQTPSKSCLTFNGINTYWSVKSSH